MTKRDDDIVLHPPDAETDAAGATAERPTARRASRGSRTPPAAAPVTPNEPPAPEPPDRPENGSTSRRPGFHAAGATEWGSLADPAAEAPGGTYSVGVNGHGADIGVLGTDNGSGTGVGVLGTVTNRENNQPAVYGFTQGTGPGVQGESDGPGPGLLGTDNGTGSGYAVLGELTNPLNPRAAIYGTTAGTGAAVEGDSTGAGPGLFGFSEGTGPGVRGSSVGSNVGVEGQSSGTGAGVLALNDGSGPALEVHGPATFSRSGLARITAKKRSVTVSFPGVTATSMVLATMQTAAKGIGVAAAVPATDSFTIKLTKTTKIDVVVAWFVLGS